MPTPSTNNEPPPRRPAALVTGASSGIGLELARLLARDGYDLVLVARGRPELEALAAELAARHGVTVEVMAKDLSDPAAPDEIFAALRDEGIKVDVLVNNAGFGSQGPFARAELAGQLRMLQVNVVAVTHLTRLLLPGMLERGRGRVLNVASTAAFQPGPLMAVYYASKAYVLWFSEALAEELRNGPVTVTALCPGPTATAFNRRGNIFKTRRSRGAVMDAAAVARAGYEGMLKGRRVVIPGLRNRMIATASRLAPRRLVTKVARKMNRAT